MIGARFRVRLAPGMTFEIGPPFTIQPRLVCNNGQPIWGNSNHAGDRRHHRAFGAGRLRGGDASIEQPTMYLSMANGGATLDPQAAASMISLYRQNNGLGAVVVDPDLMKLAEAQSQAMASRTSSTTTSRRRWPSGWAPPDIPPRWRWRMSPPAITRWRKHFRAGATRRRTGPICSKTVSQNWASRRAMLQTPNTRCSGRSFLHHPEPDNSGVIARCLASAD